MKLCATTAFLTCVAAAGHAGGVLVPWREGLVGPVSSTARAVDAESALSSAIRGAVHDAVAKAVSDAHASHDVGKTPAAGVKQPAQKTAELGLLQATRLGKSSARGSTGSGGPLDHDIPYSTYDNRMVTNPYIRDSPLNVMDTLYPIAPEDRLMRGVDAQSGFVLPPSYKSRLIYYPKRQEIVNPFPQLHPDPSVKWGKQPEVPIRLRKNRLVCSAQPPGWADSKGYSCTMYKRKQWCSTAGGPGDGWNKDWGPITAYMQNAVSATQACCECGGGMTTVVVGETEKNLADRRIIAPGDKLPDPDSKWFEASPLIGASPIRVKPALQAPEEDVGLPIPPVAPADTIPDKFARYFNEVNEKVEKPDPAGFSLRYYLNAVPAPCSPVPPSASVIDRALDYSWSTGFLAGRPLRWPVTSPDAVRPMAGTPWWGVWSGSLQIFKPGLYMLDLELGFVTESVLKVDGAEVLSFGQCGAARKDEDCLAMQCVWEVSSGTCRPPTMPGGTQRRTTKPMVQLSAGGHCIEVSVLVTNFAKSLKLLYSGPDTDSSTVVVPSVVLFCDPIVKACKTPALQACAAQQARCGPSGMASESASSAASAAPGQGSIADPGFALL